MLDIICLIYHDTTAEIRIHRVVPRVQQHLKYSQTQMGHGANLEVEIKANLPSGLKCFISLQASVQHSVRQRGTSSRLCYCSEAKGQRCGG